MIELILLFLVLFVFGLWVYPISTKKVASCQQSIFDYDVSVRHIEQKIQEDKLEAADYGGSLLLTHGKRVERCIVFYHGYTNCPRQYEELAKRFFDAGYNVYVPRVPHHGIKDLYTQEISRLTIEELIEVCDHSVDLAHGLGEKVVVCGLSMGGVMAAWCAQMRADIDRCMVIVPSFGWYFLPGIIRPLINFSRLFPNQFLWWDLIKKDNRQCPYSMYHHFSSKGLGHILHLGLSVCDMAKKKGPLSKRIVVIINQMDYAVDGVSTRRLIKRWKKNGAQVDVYEFSKDLKMEHDIIDPLHPYARVDEVYNKIFDLIK